MSRSRRVAGTPPVDQGRGAKGSILTDAAGALRGGWVTALTVLAWAAVSLGTQLLLASGFGALFGAWGVYAGNIHLAPAWARLVYGWHGSAITAVRAAAVIALALGLRRALRLGRPGRDSLSRGGRAALAGAGAAVLLAALFLMTDSLRADWPLTRPRLSAGLPALLGISLLSVLAGEMLTKRVLFDALRPRWGSVWASAAATLLFFLESRGYAGGPVGAVNALLLGALCCALYARAGSLWIAAGLRWGWSAANLFLLGFGGGEQAVYRLYGVSENWLTGGDAGLICGLGTTLALLAALAWLAKDTPALALYRKKRK